MSSVDALEKKIRERAARVGIVGLGYVGLPLAVEFSCKASLPKAVLLEPVVFE